MTHAWTSKGPIPAIGISAKLGSTRLRRYDSLRAFVESRRNTHPRPLSGEVAGAFTAATRRVRAISGCTPESPESKNLVAGEGLGVR